MRKICIILLGCMLSVMLVGCYADKAVVEKAVPAITQGEDTLTHLVDDLSDKVNEATEEK